ncbi:MAG: hypothetical protein AMXMBFR36_38470 [Acidobacteriota bacterium]
MNRFARYSVACLPALLAGVLLHGPAVNAELARRDAEASPLESLAAPLPSQTYGFSYWRDQARRRSAEWRAAVAACQDVEFHDRPNCLTVAALRHLELVS